jgi:hypothetical protein
MSKLPLSAANVWHVADTLAKAAGSRDRISLADVMSLVAGTSAEVATHFAGWLVGSATPAKPTQPAAAKTPPKTTAEKTDGPRGGDRPTAKVRVRAGDSPVRNATKEELDRVMKVALSAPKVTTKSFLRDVWEVHLAKPKAPRRTSRPADQVRKRQWTPRRPEAPRDVRTKRVNARLEAIRVASGATLSGTLRRVRDSDWKGAANEFLARFAATVLRNTGYPMMPTDICRGIAAAGGPDLRKPGRDLPPALEGSRMCRVAGQLRGQIWFDGEPVPKRPPKSQRRDTTQALVIELARGTFATALDIMRPLGKVGISVKELSVQLGPDTLAPFNRDWLKQKLWRAHEDPNSPVTKIEGGFAYVAARKSTAARAKAARRR